MERKAAARGDSTAKDLLALLENQPAPLPVPKAVNCERINPQG